MERGSHTGMDTGHTGQYKYNRDLNIINIGTPMESERARGGIEKKEEKKT